MKKENPIITLEGYRNQTLQEIVSLIPIEVNQINSYRKNGVWFVSYPNPERVISDVYQA